MEIKNIRIDSRLIHGQVSTVWIKELEPTRIVIVDDEIVSDKLSKVALKMACPEGIKLSIINVDRFIENIETNKYGDEKIFMIAKKISTLIKLYEKGYKFKDVTVGNISSNKESKQILKSISLSDSDISILKKLSNLGVKINAQMVPADKELDLIEMI